MQPIAVRLVRPDKHGPAIGGDVRRRLRLCSRGLHGEVEDVVLTAQHISYCLQKFRVQTSFRDKSFEETSLNETCFKEKVIGKMSFGETSLKDVIQGDVF